MNRSSKLEFKLWLNLIMSISMIMIIIYLGIVNSIQALKCPKLTKTELGLRMIESAKLNFIDCKNEKQ